MKNLTLIAVVAGLAMSSAAFAQRNSRGSYRNSRDGSNSYATNNSSGSGVNTGNFDDDYGVISQRNMFSRERHAPRVDNGQSRRPQKVEDPIVIARSFVLRGVAIEDAELHAYLENSRTGEVARVAPGDRLADGLVMDIAIDAIAFAVDGRTTWIEIGQSLSGARSAVPPPTTSASTQPTSNNVPLPPGGGTLEERLKARRQQMRGGK